MIKFLITLLIAFTGTFTVYNYVPLKYLELPVNRQNLGSTITTILGTDTLSSSRSVINTNFSNLNTDKFESGSTGTTLTLTTSLTTGKIIETGSATSTYSGGIESPRIGSAFFFATSTATSTFTGGLSVGGINSTKGITIASGFGALNSLSTATSSLSNGLILGNGCIYLSNSSTCLLPLDLSSNYTWTGTGTTTYTATTSVSGLFVRSGVSGNISRLLSANTNNVTSNGTATASTTMFSVTVPPNVLYPNGSNGVVTVHLNISNLVLDQPSQLYVELLYGSTSIFTMSTTTTGITTNAPATGTLDIELYGNGATNSQEANMNIATRGFSGMTSGRYDNTITGTASVDSTQAQTLSVVVRWNQASINTMTISSARAYLEL